MNNLQSFSLSTNLQIREPFLQREYFPLDIDFSKAIVILNTFEEPRKQSRVYDYFQDVIDLASNELAKHGYFFFQPLTGREAPLRCRNSNHILTPNQVAYLIDNCPLVICNDNVYAHIANHSKVKTICLFGPSSPISHSPKFNDGYTVIRESLNSPTYRLVEFLKSVNENKVEIVVNSIYSALKVKSTLKSKTLFVGKHYPLSFVEIVPDSIINPENFKDKVITIRMDYFFNEEICYHILQNRKCNIITDREINLDLVKATKHNILNFNFQVNKFTSVNYVKELIATGIKVIFFSDENDADLSATRMNLFDLSLVEKFEKAKPIDSLISQVSDNTYYRTNNFLLSDGKIYATKENYLNKISIPSFSQNILKFNAKDLSLWESLEFCRVFDLT